MMLLHPSVNVEEVQSHAIRLTRVTLRELFFIRPCITHMQYYWVHSTFLHPCVGYQSLGKELSVALCADDSKGNAIEGATPLWRFLRAWEREGRISIPANAGNNGERDLTRVHEFDALHMRGKRA